MKDQTIKVEEFNWCLGRAIAVNDIDIDEAPPELLAELRRRIMEEISEKSIGELLLDIPYDDYESDGNPCDTCGDYTSTATWIF